MISKRTAFTLVAALAAIVALAASDGAGAAAGRVATDGVSITAQTRYTPSSLPRQRFAPIRVQGRLAVGSRGSGLDNPLTRMKVSLAQDRLRLRTAGLGVCPAQRLAETSTAEARRRCAGALVAGGKVTAGFMPEGGGHLSLSAPLSVFNGPPEDGSPTILIHAFAAPLRETYVVPATLIRGAGGRAGLHFQVDIPEIAGGRGYLASTSINVARTWRHRGRPVSYVSARCPNNEMDAHGRFDFAEGTIIAGVLTDYCAIRRPSRRR